MAVPIHLHVDGTDRDAEVRASTVRTALRDMGVEVGEMDLVEPSLWTPLETGLHITVTRVAEEREERVIPATVRIVRDAFLGPEEGKILERGRDGLEELVYRVFYDGPVVLDRKLADRHVVVKPRQEVRLVGMKGAIPSVPLSGTLAYIANGDAWVMRRESGLKRPLTRGAHLDGHAFDLSSDGRKVLYTAVPTRTPGTLNELWVVDAHVLNAEAEFTGVKDVLWAAWVPGEDKLAYSSATIARATPGWRALNDLNLVTWPSFTVTQVLSPTSAFIYSWWGETWSWAPDGRRLAYARGDELGILDLRSPQRSSLYTFRPFHSHGDWVWSPTVAWGPDSESFVASVHRGIEEEPSFDLLMFHVRDREHTEVARDVGPWCGPAWSASGSRLAFGVLTEAAGPAEFYRLHQVRADDLTHAIPVSPEEVARASYVEICWSPSGPELVLTREGDLCLFDLEQGTVDPLTATGVNSHPRWR